MDLAAEYLETIRTHHVAMLMALQRKLSREHGEVVMEMLAEIDDADGNAQPMRLDAVVAGPKIFTLEVEPVPNIGFGMRFEREGATIAIGRFSWNHCTVRTRIDEADGREVMRMWALRWLDLADERPTNQHGLNEVIHGVRSIAYEDGSLHCDVDLGSASTDAVHELLMALLARGASVVAFGGVG